MVLARPPVPGPVGLTECPDPGLSPVLREEETPQSGERGDSVIPDLCKNRLTATVHSIEHNPQRCRIADHAGRPPPDKDGIDGQRPGEIKDDRCERINKAEGADTDAPDEKGRCGGN